jgi:glutamate-1-semialdehyde aminotransferase
MTENLAQVVEAKHDWNNMMAIGGTLFGNALSLAAARATLEQVLTEEAYSRTARLGARLADGIDAAVQDVGLEWRAQRLFSRSGYSFSAQLPRNAIEAAAAEDYNLKLLIRVFMANRGVWEAIPSAGPAASFAMTEDDIDSYLQVFSDCVNELTR